MEIPLKSHENGRHFFIYFFRGQNKNLFVNLYRKKEHDTTPLFIKKIILQIMNFTCCLGYNFFISKAILILTILSITNMDLDDAKISGIPQQND